MMFGFVPISFRFRGKLARLQAIYYCFLDNPGTGLHPSQIARHTGLRLAEVSARLEATPELFVRLPRRSNGLTRYRLTSSMTARSPEEVQRFLAQAARKESLLLYAVAAMVLLTLLIVVILVGPAV